MSVVFPDSLDPVIATLSFSSTASWRTRRRNPPSGYANSASRTAITWGSLIGFAVILNLVPLERYLGVQMSLSLGALASILLVSVPLMVFVVALQMMIASYTKSFKEAQNYISGMLLIPAIPALAMAILSVRESLWLALLPTVGQQLFINRILRAEEVSPSHLLISSVTTLAAGAILLALVVRRYSREAILFR